MYSKHVPAPKRRTFSEGRKNGDMKEKATYAVLATFRHSEDTLKGLGITPLKQTSTNHPNILLSQSLKDLAQKGN